MKMNSIRRALLVAFAARTALVAMPAMADKAKPKLGFSIDDLRVERWARDRDYFVEAAKKLGTTSQCAVGGCQRTAPDFPDRELDCAEGRRS